MAGPAHPHLSRDHRETLFRRDHTTLRHNIRRLFENADAEIPLTGRKTSLAMMPTPQKWRTTMQTSSMAKSETAGSQLDTVLSQSVEGGLQSIHVQIDQTARFLTKMRVQRRTGAIAGQTAIELFRVHNEAKERAIAAVIVAKHGILQKELLKANLAATAELDAAIAGIFMETRARLTKITSHDEQALYEWEVAATEDFKKKVG